MIARLSLLTSTLALTLAGCATPRHLEHDGVVRVDASEDRSYDYRLSFKNMVYPGWDGNKSADRRRTAKEMFAGRCPRMKVIDETSIGTGQFLIGGPSVTWVMKVKCDGAA